MRYCFGNFKCKPEVIGDALAPASNRGVPGKFIKNAVYLEAIK